MTVLIPGMNLDHERIELKPRAVSPMLIMPLIVVVIKTRFFAAITSQKKSLLLQCLKSFLTNCITQNVVGEF